MGLQYLSVPSSTSMYDGIYSYECPPPQALWMLLYLHLAGFLSSPTYMRCSRNDYTYDSIVYGYNIIAKLYVVCWWSVHVFKLGLWLALSMMPRLQRSKTFRKGWSIFYVLVSAKEKCRVESADPLNNIVSPCLINIDSLTWINMYSNAWLLSSILLTVVFVSTPIFSRPWLISSLKVYSLYRTTQPKPT